MAKEAAIQLYYSETPSSVPLAVDLLPGELAINIADQVAYFEDAASSVKIFGATEKVYILTGTELNPATNGTIQTKNITDNTTFTNALSTGQSMVLMLTNAGSHMITWPTITWVGGEAPTLTDADTLIIWMVDATLYGAYVGSME